MSDILQTSKQFTAGESVTHTGLNNIIGGTSFVTGVEKTADESTIIVDPTGGYLKAGVMQEANIGNNQVTFGKMQRISGDRVIGNNTASNAQVRAITIEQSLSDGAGSDTLVYSDAVKDYVDTEVSEAIRTYEPNIDYVTYTANTTISFSGENSYEDIPMFATLVARKDNSKFRVSGTLNFGFYKDYLDYSARIMLQINGGGYQLYNVPSSGAIGGKDYGHFAVSSQLDNNNQILSFNYDYIIDEASVNLQHYSCRII